MTNREVDGVAVVALDGRIVLGEESNALREKVKSLLAEGKKKIVLNMDNVTFIDSAGLGTLVASHHTVKTQGASLRLCHLSSKFQEVLQITKLLTVFDVYKTEVEAQTRCEILQSHARAPPFTLQLCSYSHPVRRH